MQTTFDRRIAVIAIVTVGAIGCASNLAFERISRARAASADLVVQFTKAVDAANKAVMADTDEASVAFAREAEQAKQAIRTDIDTLHSLLADLGYADESRLLQEFVVRFAQYGELDDRVLGLAVQNTNLKAQRLSFGPALEAADAVNDALGQIVPRNQARDTWRVKAITGTAVAAVREIQALQAPHIAEADDAAMTRMEARIASAEAAARTAIEALAPLVSAGSRPRLDAATAALDRFMAVHSEIMGLSRRNTNVRALALTLNQKGQVTRACEDSLRALRDALAKRGFTGTR